MKFQSLLLTASLAFTSIASANWIDDYADLLKTYATPSGVKYAALKKNTSDTAKLASITSAIAKTAAPTDKNEQLAFYINAYNAWMLDKALAKYPGKGVLEGDSDFFKKNIITVSGTKMSFDHLENGIIRKKFNEPRIHFAVNCASGGCPPLIAQPFRGKTLDAQLSAVTQAFINSESGVKKSGKTVRVSKIFEWYAKDFGKLIPFLNKYSKKRIPLNSKVVFKHYDWNFNEAK